MGDGVQEAHEVDRTVPPSRLRRTPPFGGRDKNRSPTSSAIIIGGCRGVIPLQSSLGGAGGSSPCNHHRPETEGAMGDGQNASR
jgi:hypothetical protein